MAQIIPPGYAHVIQPFQHSASGKAWSVTYGLVVGLAGRTPLQVVNACDAVFRAAWRPLLDTNISFQPAVSYTNDGGAGLILTTSTVAAQAGLASRNSPPPQVAVCVRKRTARVGRAFRGRVFLPGMIDETNVDETGIITPAGVTALQTAATSWLTNQNAQPESMVLLHQKDFPPGTNPPTSVTSLVVQPIVRTQRRRLPKG